MPGLSQHRAGRLQAGRPGARRRLKDVQATGHCRTGWPGDDLKRARQLTSGGMVDVMTLVFQGDDAASRVYASATVATLIGAETLARLRGEAFRRYWCC